MKVQMCGERPYENTIQPTTLGSHMPSRSSHDDLKALPVRHEIKILHVRTTLWTSSAQLPSSQPLPETTHRCPQSVQHDPAARMASFPSAEVPTQLVESARKFPLWNVRSIVLKSTSRITYTQHNEPRRKFDLGYGVPVEEELATFAAQSKVHMVQ